MIKDFCTRFGFFPFLLIIFLTGCLGEKGQRQKTALFVGIDVSGSFRSHGHHEDALEFLAYYLYGHLNGVDGLSLPKDLFVSEIGGDKLGEPKSFHPIHDFQGKSVSRIHADLKKWFSHKEDMTDYNIFFKQVANISQKRNLSLIPITIVLLTDGVPAYPGKSGRPELSRYEKIDISPLEYLSRNVTLRLLYASPEATHGWENSIARKRVRIWTVDDQVMAGWKAQMVPGTPLPEQKKLWQWVVDNVDFRVRSTPMHGVSTKKK